MADRRSFWAWGMESEEPSDADRAALAAKLSARYGTEIMAAPVPRAEDAPLRAPRLAVPDRLAEWCETSTYERAFHAYGATFPERTRAFNLQFPDPPDVPGHGRDHLRFVGGRVRGGPDDRAGQAVAGQPPDPNGILNTGVLIG